MFLLFWVVFVPFWLLVWANDDDDDGGGGR
jgi:hypothetical protein